MSKNVHALNSEIKNFIDCSLIEQDSDFLINVTNCNETFIAGELTFNPMTSKNSLTGWFNVTGDYVSSGQFTIRKSATNRIPFALYLKDLKIDLSKINLVLKWGTNSSTVSVTQNTVYRVSGNEGTYSVDFQKSSCTTGKPCGSESNITIFNYNLPPYTTTTFKGFSNGTLGNAITIGKANSSLIESGPARVVIVAQNLSNNMCDGSANNGCLNYTNLVYAYPTFYQNYYVFTFNKSLGLTQGGSGLGFVIIQTTPNNTDNPRFDEVNNRTVNGASYSYSIDMGTGGDSVPLGNANTSIGFAFDDADHNRTVLWKNTITNFTNNTITYAGQDSTERMAFGFGSLTGKELNPAGTYAFGYLVMFGQNGQKTVANNQTVWNNDFEEQYRAWYNPASMTAVVGTQQSRNNITGSYNYTANGTMADFNFTTIAGMNYTYPVFEIQNISNISAVKVFWKNYTASSNWAELTNWTDYVLQEGNSSYFGYNYILLLINKTLGRETANAEVYEFMVNNTTIAAPTGTIYETMFNVSSKASMNIPSRVTNLSRTLNVVIHGSLNSVRIVNYGRLLNVMIHGSNTFSGIYNQAVQYFERLFNIVTRSSLNAIRNIDSIRYLIITIHGSGQFIRLSAVSRLINVASITKNNFLSNLIGGLQTFERWFNAAVKSSSNFIRSSTITAWLNVREKIGSTFQRVVSLSKIFSQGMSMSANMFGNSIRTRFMNIFIRESSGFTRMFVVSRLYSNVMKMAESFNGIYNSLFNIFERVLNIPVRMAERFIIAARTWVEPRIYDVCSILQQIGDSRAYLCVYDTGEWKIIIRGV